MALRLENESVVRALLERIAQDPLPAEDTSSHWQFYGQQVTATVRDGHLDLRPSGFHTIEGNLKGRVIAAVERWSYRQITSSYPSFSKVWRVAAALARDLGGIANFHVLTSACAVALLADHCERYELAPRYFAVIGDGDGYLGALIRRYFRPSQLYSIDLPKMLLFQFRTHEQLDRETRIALLGHRSDRPSSVTLVLPSDIEAIGSEIDCAINVASMQEMTAASIAKYFAFLRRRSNARSRFYCVNREEKVLPGGERIAFDDYPWRAEDLLFVDGACPYYTHVLAPYTRARGPRFLGLRVPFVNYFDGTVLHRLAHLAPSR